MEAEIKKPSPPGRWEKALTRLYWWVLLGGMLISSILRVPLGFWPSLALTVTVIVAFTLVVARLAASEREARLVRDVERGLIECAIRYSKALPGSLSSRWEPGFAEVNNGNRNAASRNATSIWPIRSCGAAARRPDRYSHLPAMPFPCYRL
jgi:hypothetical protein